MRLLLTLILIINICAIPFISFARSQYYEDCIMKRVSAKMKLPGTQQYKWLTCNEYAAYKEGWQKPNWALPNEPLVEVYSEDQNNNSTQGYPDTPQKHYSVDEMMQRDFNNRVYLNKVRLSGTLPDVIMELRQMFYENYQRNPYDNANLAMYNMMLDIDTNYNHYFNCISNIASTEMANKYREPYYDIDRYVAGELYRIYLKCQQ